MWRTARQDQTPLLYLLLYPLLPEAPSARNWIFWATVVPSLLLAKQRSVRWRLWAKVLLLWVMVKEPHSGALWFEVDTIVSPTELHFGFATGLALEADVICGEDNQAPWRLFHDDRRLHQFLGELDEQAGTA